MITKTERTTAYFEENNLFEREEFLFKIECFSEGKSYYKQRIVESKIIFFKQRQENQPPGKRIETKIKSCLIPQ